MKQFPDRELIFCYTQSKPNTLVMLYPPQNVIKKLVQPPQQRSILWIAQNISESLHAQIQQIRSKTASTANIHIISNLNQAIDFISMNHNLNKVIVICQSEISEQINSKLNRRKQISLIIEYPSISQLEQGQDDYWDQQQKQISVIKVSKEDCVGEIIQQICSVSPHYRELMNFVSLEKEVWKSNILVRTMLAMINQQVDISTRRQILDHFLTLVSKMSQVHNLEDFVQQLKEGPLPHQKAIRWYTRSEGVNKIVNNLLRSSYHPSQIFYLQPFFQDLFKQIQNLHRKELRKNFVCYRGGYLCVEEAESLKDNLGKIVQSLSFLSTSLSKHTAIQFAKNAFFEIAVDDQQVSEFQYGFASVQSFSEYSYEQEIIFNPLCSFKILQVQQYQGIQDVPIKYCVKFEYGKLGKIINDTKKSNGINLTENDKCLVSLAKIWKSLQSQIIDQSTTIVLDQTHVLTNGSDYCQSLDHKLKGFTSLAISYQIKGSFKQSQRIMQLALQQFQAVCHADIIGLCKQKQSLSASEQLSIKLYSKIKVRLIYSKLRLKKKEEVQIQCKKTIIPLMNFYGLQDNNYFVFLALMVNIVLQKKQYQRARQIHEKICELHLKQYGEYHPKYINSLNSLVSILGQVGQYERARKLTITCSRLLLMMVGERHPIYIQSLIGNAETMIHLREYQKADRLFEKCYKLAVEILGEGDEIYQKVVKSYVQLLYYLGNSEKSKQLLENNVGILLNKEQHYTFEESSPKIMNQLLLQEKQQESLLKMREGLQIALKLYGQKHQFYLTKLNNMASVLMSFKKYEESEQLFKKCCQIKLKYYGSKNVGYINYLSNLAILYSSTKRQQEAVSIFQKCSALALQIYGEQHPCSAQYLLKVAQILFSLGQKQKGQTYLLKCLSINYQKSQASNIDQFTTLSLLAQLLTAQKNYTSACQIYKKSSQLVLKMFQPTHPRYIKYLSDLAYFNFQIGNYGQALQMQRFCCYGRQGDGDGGDNGDHEEQGRRLSSLVYFLVGLGDYWGALVVQGRLYKLGKLKRLQLNVLKTSAYILSQLAQYQKSLKILKLLQKTEPQSFQTLPLTLNLRPKPKPKSKLKKNLQIKIKKQNLKISSLYRCIYSEFYVIQM